MRVVDDGAAGVARQVAGHVLALDVLVRQGGRGEAARVERQRGEEQGKRKKGRGHRAGLIATHDGPQQVTKAASCDAPADHFDCAIEICTSGVSGQPETKVAKITKI